MKGQTMQAACYSLGILYTFNRPRTSNDNAHMEASFKLLKHGRVIEIPSYFHSIEHARAWCKGYYDWYNKEQTDLFETGALFLVIQPLPLLFWTGYSITAVFLLSTVTVIDLCPQEKKNYWKKTINRYNLQVSTFTRF